MNIHKKSQIAYKVLFLSLIVIILIGVIVFSVWNHSPGTDVDNCYTNKDGKLICDSVADKTTKTSEKTPDYSTTKTSTEIYCGNGECDSKELAQGICPEDCGQTTNKTNQTKPNQNQSQNEGAYEPTSFEPYVCGNGYCEYSYETIQSCPSDCPQEVCGNNVCELFETNVGCPQDCNVNNAPYTFVVIHEESWGGLDEIVNMANEYNIKLSIFFWPGVAEYILNDSNRINQVRQWQSQGHEVGIHDQLCCPQTNTTKTPMGYFARECYREGDADMYVQLAGNQNVTAGTPVCAVDEGHVDWLPDTYKYTMIGRGEGRNVFAFKGYEGSEFKYYTMIIKGSYAELSPQAGTVEKINQYITLKPTEIFGTAFHTGDYTGCEAVPDELLFMPCNPGEWPRNEEPLKVLFKFLYDKEPTGAKRKTMTDVMEDYVLPNNLVADYSQIMGSNDSAISKCRDTLNPHFGVTNLPISTIISSDTTFFNYGRCITEGTYCENEPNRYYPNPFNANILGYYGGKCLVKNIEDAPPLPESYCGDGYCDGFAGEKTSCIQDCSSGAVIESSTDKIVVNQTSSGCGDSICDGASGEKTSCPEDCQQTDTRDNINGRDAGSWA